MTFAAPSPGTRPGPDLSAVRLFVFDFDGTLVASNAIKRESFYDVTAGIEGAAAVLKELFRTVPHLDRYGIFREFARRVPGSDGDALASAYTERCTARILAAPEVPGAARLLQALGESGRISVIVSSTPQAPLRELVKRMPIAPLVAAVYGEPVSKPNNLAAAMAAAGADAQATVVHGDGESDRRAADGAGCTFVAVHGDHNDFAAPPRWAVRRLDEIVAWL